MFIGIIIDINIIIHVIIILIKAKICKILKKFNKDAVFLSLKYPEN